MPFIFTSYSMYIYNKLVEFAISQKHNLWVCWFSKVQKLCDDKKCISLVILK